MGSFDLIYVATTRGGEFELLSRLTPVIEQLDGRHQVRIKVGSGWLQIQPLAEEEMDAEDDEDSGLSNAIDLLNNMILAQQQPELAGELFGPSDKDNACTISRLLQVDTVYVMAVTSVDGLQFTRCRNGNIVRNFVYSPQDGQNDGWPEDDGEEEAWEQPWKRPHSGQGPHVTDIGVALGLPGLEADYSPTGDSFDFETTIIGQSRTE